MMTLHERQHTEKADLDCVVWLQRMGVWVGGDEQHLFQISVEVIEIPHLHSQAEGLGLSCAQWHSNAPQILLSDLLHTES